MGPGRAAVKSTWANVKGLRMHALTAGDEADRHASAVVCVHGMIVSSRYMVPTVERLGSSFRVYAPDLPGYGVSAKPPRVPDVPRQADAIVDWMDAIQVERVSLLGNSYGCQIAASVAARYPERVDRVVLVGPTTNPSQRTHLRLMVSWQLELSREPLDYIALQVRDSLRAGLRRAWQTYRHMMTDRIEDNLAQIEAPTLVIRGGRDSIVSEAWGKEAASIVPNGRFICIPGALHPINYTSPLELARVVTPFLDESSAL
jgi:2-hydroxy-6-oxonona-2,4-dienedioate hydrolase